MSLAAESRLGPYEIVGPLGAGGMGEVYLASFPALEKRVFYRRRPGAEIMAVDATLGGSVTLSKPIGIAKVSPATPN